MAPRHSALKVLIDSKPAGLITRTNRGTLAFTYSQEYQQLTGATPLSVSMAIGPVAATNGVIRPWLAGLLPDNDAVLRKWANHFHVSTDPFSLLGTAIGLDCAGAVQFVPESDGTTAPGPMTGALVKQTPENVGQRLAQLRADSTAWLGVDFEGRFSLAGAQAKTALRFQDGQWFLPSGLEPTTHILKPAIQGIYDHDLNEHLCLRTAGLLGLRAAHSAIMAFGTERAVVITRYDRVTVDGVLRRIHQEDMCQALSISPSTKYQNEGGPTPAAIVRLLREQLPRSEAEPAVHRFAEALIFNWIIGGTDAHAKNYSLLLLGSQVRLAPLYDVSSALLLGDHQKLRLAMKFGSDYRLNVPRPQIWPVLSASVGLTTHELTAIAQRLIDGVPDAFAQVASAPEVAALGSPLPDLLTEALAERVKRCQAALH